MGQKINLPAVLVAAVVYWMLGAVWFTILKEPWLAGTGKTVEQLMKDGSPAAAYGTALVCNLLIAYALAWVLAQAGGQTAVSGLKIGLMLGFAFAFTAMVTEFAFEARSLQFMAIAAGYPIVAFALSGAILGAWKSKTA